MIIEKYFQKLLKYRSIGNIFPILLYYVKFDIYLEGIFSTIVYIAYKMLLESILSTKKISDTLTSKGLSTSNHTVENYISAFVESFLIYKAERFDIKGKNLLNRDYRYYVVDQGLRS